MATGRQWTPRQALLRDSLAVAVPLWVGELADLEPSMRWARIEEWRAAAVEPISSRGDILQYGGKLGQAVAVFNHLARALAALAFTPGGVTFADLHFERTEDEESAA